MKPRILVAREVFPEVIERLSRHFEVDANQADVVLGVEAVSYTHLTLPTSDLV